MMRQPAVLGACRLYGAYKRGITPNARGMRQETAYYAATMALMEQLEGEAEAWYFDEQEKKRGQGRN